MEIEVLTRSKQKGISELLGNSAAFFAKKLNVEKCNYKVYICTKRNLKREGHMGLCAKTGEREITVAVDSNLPLPNILYTLAHEMVHVKQICRGQYRSEILRNGRVAHFWMGKRVKAEYSHRPWEREAFMREGLLTRFLSDMVEKSDKKGKSRI